MNLTKHIHEWIFQQSDLTITNPIDDVDDPGSPAQTEQIQYWVGGVTFIMMLLCLLLGAGSKSKGALGKFFSKIKRKFK
jgi:hypothetical protein